MKARDTSDMPACPRCGAKAGEPCRALGFAPGSAARGQTMWGVHAARDRADQKMLGERARMAIIQAARTGGEGWL